MKKYLLLCFLAIPNFTYSQLKGVINDKDGYTNMRAEMGTTFAIVGRLYEGEVFTYYPIKYTDWAVVEKNNGQKGFVYRNRIKIDEESKSFEVELYELTDTSSWYFLIDKKLRDVTKINAEYLLNYNLIISQILDSLCNPLKEVRDFYFPVAEKIIMNADGDLAEGIGSYIWAYLEKYPKDFADRFRCCQGKEKCCEKPERLCSFIAFEIYFSENQQKDLNNLFFSIDKNYPNARNDKTIIFIKENIKRSLKEMNDH